MSVVCKEEGVRRPSVLYIRGIPYKCPEPASKSQERVCDLVDSRPMRSPAGLCPSRLAARRLADGEGDPNQAREGLMRRRRAVRVFTGQAVPLGLLRDLLIRACADLGRDSRHVRCVMVESPRAMERVRELTCAWMVREGLTGRTEGTGTAGGDPFGGAPHLVAIHGPRDLAAAVEACALAVARVEWAAAGAGLGVCFAGELVAAAAADAALAATLTVPEEHAVHGALLLGYSAFAVRDPDSAGRVKIIWM